jgi:hypothetical protein
VLTPVALRLAGIVALFVAWGSYLSARSSELSTRQAGVVVTGFALALIALHAVVLRRAEGRPAPDAMLAAMLGALPVVPGLVLLLWRTPGAGATVLLFYAIDNHVLAKALLLAAAIYAAAWAAARQPLAAGRRPYRRRRRGGVALERRGRDRQLAVLGWLGAVPVHARGDRRAGRGGPSCRRRRRAQPHRRGRAAVLTRLRAGAGRPPKRSARPARDCAWRGSRWSCAIG